MATVRQAGGRQVMVATAGSGSSAVRDRSGAAAKNRPLTTVVV